MTLDCPVCGEPIQAAHDIVPGESIVYYDIYYGPGKVCISKEGTRIYAHGEPQ